MIEAFVASALSGPATQQTAAAAPALAQPVGGPMQPAAATPSAAGGDPSLPTVGTGRELAWARSWADLSQRMRGAGLEAESRWRAHGAGGSPDDLVASMGDLLSMNRRLTETSIQFQLLTGAVSNASSAVHKLLTQQ